jgi:hypothetical protein
MSGAIGIVQADPPSLSRDNSQDLPGTVAMYDKADRVSAHGWCPGERVISG